MYRIAICEDDATTREQIASLCGEILARLDTEHAISEFDCAEALEGALEAGASFDLLCLDIMLQGKTGVEMAQAFRTRDDQTSILLISSSREFLKEGYSVRPLQYLYKPVDPRELEEVLRTDLRLHRRAARLTLSLGGKTRVLPLSELLYVESQNHNAVACFPDRQEGFRITLSEIERLLPADLFCRCHHSFLVNMSHIRQINRRALELDQGSQIPVGRNYYETVQAKFIQFLAGR